MKTLFGQTEGLKTDALRRLEKLYRRRVPIHRILTPELGRELAQLSHTIKRQIGLLLDRQGRVAFVIVGTPHKIVIPDTRHYRAAPGRLLGLRCVHTHLDDTPLTTDDVTDLALLRLDLMTVITLDAQGDPLHLHTGHIQPVPQESGPPCQILDPLRLSDAGPHCLELIQALEDEMARRTARVHRASDQERALLVSVATEGRARALESLHELKDLALSCGIEVVDTLLQLRKQQDARFLMGPGKLQEMTLMALQLGISLIIVDQELNPSQMRSITDQIQLKVIDRTQLILDIFAQRASSREGKLQVELAQLKYLQPRLVTKNTAMSRLTGGIGGRGPGETKLEINRRRVRERIGRLEKELAQVSRRRTQQKARRTKRDLPIISIIGYTNAGKSTLLNTLTQSEVLAEQRMFATLDPSSRRLRFPREMEVIITDTVGFIRNLPDDLKVAFRATLEELHSANLLLHVIDISHPHFADQVQTVEALLAELELDTIPCVRALNKSDLVDAADLEREVRLFEGIPICARDRRTLMPLLLEMESILRGAIDLNVD